MTSSTVRTALAITVAVVVVAAVGAAFVIVGSPREARFRRVDERRVADLRQISRSVALYWTVHEALPASLAELSDLGGVTVPLRDPDAGTSYRYRVLALTRYELCAEFDRAAAERAGRSTTEFWSHGEGLQCFDLAPTETGR